MDAEAEKKYGSTSGEINGIVRWPLIEALLSRKLEMEEDFKQRDITLKVLRSFFFCILSQML